MRAVILAGGKGQRLRPYTTLIPKPLVPVGDKYSILEIILLQLRNNGFTHITIAVNHLAHLISSYFGDGSRLGIKIDYSIEDRELSTIAPLKLIDDLPKSFLVMNGDILSDIDYLDFYSYHLNKKSDISVACFKRDVNIDFGVIESSNNIVTGFTEKPSLNYNVSMGVYCLNKTVLDRVPVNSKYGFDDLMYDWINSNKDIHVYPFDGYWLDIGRPDDYERANNEINLFLSKIGLSE